MSLIYSLPDNIPYSTVKMEHLRLNLTEVKDVKTSSLTNNIKLSSTSMAKSKCSQVMAPLILTNKKILNFSDNVNPSFKIDFKSLKQIKLCEGPSNIYTHGHTILAESACIYEVNASHTVFIDPVDYLTHEIYFTASSDPKIYSCLGERLNST